MVNKRKRMRLKYLKNSELAIQRIGRTVAEVVEEDGSGWAALGTQGEDGV